jgi:branched-chain amino acid transport system substrate-binding protein
VTYQEGEAIQIRSLEAISGDVAFLGIPNQRGTEIAIADYGDVQGFSVELGTPLDDLCSADGGQSAAQTIVSDDTVAGVIGTSCSGAGVPASELISSAGMVMVSASNTNPALTQTPFGTEGENFSEGYFRTAHNDLYQGAAVAEFVYNELGLTQMAAIHDGDPYTDGLTTAFQDAFRSSAARSWSTPRSTRATPTWCRCSPRSPARTRRASSSRSSRRRSTGSRSSTSTSRASRTSS